MIALILVSALVVVAEMMNTALEEIVNLMLLIRKVRAKVAKDVAAGSVLMMAVVSLIIGGMIFIPRIINLVVGKYRI